MPARKTYVLMTVLVSIITGGVFSYSAGASLPPAPAPAPAAVVPAMPATRERADAVDAHRKPSLQWGNELYSHYCTPCHGGKGDGNGFNAPRLLVKPANHTDAKFMGERDDTKLFDTINLGGGKVAKSTLMPPWGASLNNDNKIKSLIMKLRDLCRCQAAKGW